jgi:NTE family protein
LCDYDIDPQRFSVARAVSMSARIPYFFDPARLHDSTIVDGSLLSNFPVWLFDESGDKTRDLFPTVGFNLVGTGPAEARPIQGPLSMFGAMFSTMLNAHDRRMVEDDRQLNIINIPTAGVSSTKFDLSVAERMKLYESGYVAGSAFFRDRPNRTDTKKPVVLFKR